MRAWVATLVLVVAAATAHADEGLCAKERNDMTEATKVANAWRVRRQELEVQLEAARANNSRAAEDVLAAQVADADGRARHATEYGRTAYAALTACLVARKPVPAPPPTVEAPKSDATLPLAEPAPAPTEPAPQPEPAPPTAAEQKRARQAAAKEAREQRAADARDAAKAKKLMSAVVMANMCSYAQRRANTVDAVLTERRYARAVGVPPDYEKLTAWKEDLRDLDERMATAATVLVRAHLKPVGCAQKIVRRLVPCVDIEEGEERPDSCDAADLAEYLEMDSQLTW